MIHRARRASWWARAIGLVVACLTALGGFGPARAATIYWNGTEATWASVTAWSTTAGAVLPTPGSVPGAADDVIFGISPLFWANQTVNLGADQSALSLSFTSGGTTLLQGGGTNRSLTLGSGGISVAGGAGVVTIGSGTAGQNVALALNGNQTWTNNSVSPTGASTLNVLNGVSRAATDTSSRTLTLDGTGFTNISGIIANGGASGTLALSKTGTGTLILSGANTFSGGVSLSAGTLRVGNNAALGTGTLTWTGGTLAGNDATTARTLTNAITLGADVTLGSILAPANLTLSGAVSLTGNRVLTVNGTGLGGQTLSGIVSGTGFGLTKRGAGALTLSGANTFTGGFTLDTGAVRIGNNAAFGTGPLTVNGGLLSSNAATTGGDRTLTNAVTLGGSVTLGDGSTGLLTFSGPVTLTGSRTLVGNVGTTLSGVVSGAGFGLTKQGAATLTLSAANTFTGATQVDAGNLTLSGTAGAIAASGGITVNRNATLALVNTSTANNTNRIGDTAPLTLAGGTLTFSNNAGAVNYAESIGGLTLGATTLSTINTNQAATGQTATLTFDSLTRSAGAVLNVTGTGLGTDARNRVVFTTAPTVTNGLAPAWITIGGADFANYVTGATASLAIPTYTTTAENTWVAANNVSLTASTTLTADRAVNSFRMAPTSGTATVTATGRTLTLGSGGLLTAGAGTSAISGGTLTVGAADVGGELVAHQFSGSVATITSVIADNGTGPVSLTKGGTGQLGLGGVNTYTGGTTITAGTIRLDAVGALGATTGGLTLGPAGTLNLNTRSATVGVLSGSGTITNTAAGSPVLTVSSGTYSGTITSTAGTLGLTKAGPGTLTLSGLNTFTGTTTLSGGTLALQSSLAGPVAPAAGTSLDIGWSQGLMGLYTVTNIPGGATAATLADLTALNTSILANSTGAAASSALRGTNFDFTASGSGFPPPYNTGANNFVTRWTGQFNAETAGTYAFFAESDDGTVIFINGQQVLFNNYDQGVGNERGGTIDLAPGWHDITFGYRQGTGGYALNASLQAPGGAKIPLPNSLLRSAPVIGSLTLDASATMSIGAGGVVVNQTTNSAASGTISGSGSLTKVGAGTLTLDGTNLYTGGTILQGGTLVLAGGNDRLPTASLLTVGGNATLDLGGNSQTSSGLITLGGGTLTNGSLTGTGGIVIAGGTLAGTATLTSTGVAYTGQSGLVTLGLAGNSGLVKNTNGTLTLRGTNSLTGGFTVNAGTLVFNTTGASGTNAITLSGGNLQFLFDGDGGAASVGGNGTGAPQILNFADPLTVTTSGTVTVGRRGDTYTPLFTTASNKTARLTDLSIGGQNLVVANNNGYGLEFSGTTTFTAAPTFTVNNATASNMIQGLALSGPVTGAFGLTKAGNGTLVLGNSANDFAGPITVAAGRLAVPSDSALGAAANGIVLSNNAGLRATGSFSTARDIRLAVGSNVIETTAGNTLTLSAPFGGASATTQVIKADNGTLVLAAANPSTWASTISNPSGSAQTLTGGLRVDAGILRIANPAALGNAMIGINAAQGAEIELANGVTFSNPVNPNMTAGNAQLGFNAGRNGLGAVSVPTGTATLAGVISANQDFALGAGPGATLNVTGGATITVSARYMNTMGPGTVNISTNPLTGVAGFFRVGSGTTNLSVNVSALAGAGVAGEGIWGRGGGGTLNVFGGGSFASGTRYVVVQGGDTVAVDNTATALSNRLGTISTSDLYLRDGTFAFTASPDAATGETFRTWQAQHGYGNLTVNTTAQNATISFANMNGNTPNGAGTVVFRSGGTGALFGTAQNTVSFTTAPTLTNSIMARSIVLDGSTADGANFATYGSGSIRAFTAYDTTNLNAVTTATNTVQIGSSVVMNTPTRTINAMKLTGGGLALSGPGSTLTLTAGQILATGGTSAIGQGATIYSAAEIGLNVADGSTLNVDGPLWSAVHLTRGLGGTVNYNARQYVIGGNWYAFNGGTTRLNGGDNTLFPGMGVPGAQQNVSVAKGATLDLNGTAQLIGMFYNSNNSADYANTSGVITSATPALFASRSSNNTNIYFGGQITGAITTLLGGTGTRWYYSDNTYTGRTAVVGGSHVLIDSGRMSGTSGIDVNYGLFYLRNSGSLDLADRVPDAAPITLRGGYVEYNGRAQTASAETLGAVTIDSGWNTFNVTAGGTGVNSADLTLTSLTRPSGSAGVVRVATANGQFGSAARLLITAEPSLTNNIIGPWAVQDREWASYVSGLGVAQLNATGFAGYDATALTAGSNPTANVRVTGNATLAGNAIVNTFATNGGGLTVDLGGNTLTLAGGGLILGGTTNSVTQTLSNGTVTAGAAGVGGDLYMYWLPYGGTARVSAISARVADNAGGAVRLILSSPEGVGTTHKSTLTGLNVHAGGTVINGGQWDLAGSAGQVILPAGGLTLNQAGVTMLTNAGQIAAANPVTLTGGASLTLVGNNTLAGLTFDNVGGTGTPTVTTGGTLTLTAGITAGGYNPATISTINGRLDFQGADRTITVTPLEYDGRAFAPFTPNLNIGAVIQNAGTLTVSGGGVLQLGGQNTFAGGVAVAANTGLFFGAGSTQNSNIPVITSGPVGTGTLSLGAGARLMTSAAQTIDNPLTIAGNLAFEGTNNLTLRGNATLPIGTGVTFGVLAPQMTATLSGGLGGGAGTSITKTGNGILSLAPGIAGYNGTLIPSSATAITGNTFAGGATASSGTLRGEVYGAQARPFGTGAVTIDGGLLQLRTAGPTFNGNNAPGGVNGTLLVGTDVTLAAGQSLGLIELTTAGSTGNTFQMGTLTMSGTQTLGVGGSNNLRVAFTGNAITGTPTFNIDANVGLILPGGFTAPATKTGLGTLFYGGTNTFASGTTLTGALLGAAPTAGTSVSPFGTGQSVTLSNGSTLPLVTLPGSLDTAGFTAGGLLASFYNLPTTSTSLNSVGTSGVAPVGTIPGVQPNDSTMTLRPITLTQGTLVQGYATYTGLLEVTNPGVYSFISGADDQLTLVIDGSPVMSANVNGGGQAVLDNAVAGSIQLAAGTHAFAYKLQNGSGGGGFRLLYSGPDTASNGTPGGFQAIPNSKLLYQTAAPGAGNGFLNAARIGNSTVVPASASVTIDGQGSDFSVAVADLTLGTGSTLNVANQFGAGWVGVSGLTTIGGAGVIVSPNTATFALAGGVADSGAGLTKAGPGTLLLGSSGSGFTGSLAVRQGVVQPLAANALPGGGTVVGSTMTGAFNRTAGGTTVNAGSTAGLYPGMFVLGTGAATAPTIASITDGTTFVLSSGTGVTAATGGTLTFVGRSSLDLAGLAVTGAGTVTIRGNGALLPGSTTVFQQTAALYNSARTASSLSSPVAIVGAAGITNQIGGYGDMTLSGAVSDNTAVAPFTNGTGFSKIGNNTLTLSADNTGLTGPITVSRGVLRLGSAGALGTTAGATTVNSPATLDLGGFSTAEPLTINGAGLTGVGMANRLGVLINSGATAATASGAVTMAGNSSIGNAAYTWSGPSLAAATVPTAGAGSITVSGAIGGAFALTKVGNSTLFLTNGNSFSGSTNVNLGTLVLTGGGRLGATTVTTVNPNGTLVFDNTTTNNDARSGSAGARGITLNAATFNLLGGATATAESLGTGNLLVNGGFGIVTLAPGAGSLSLAVGQPTAGNFGTALYRGTNLGVNTAATAGAARITYATAPGTTGQNGADGTRTKGVVPWGLVDTSATGSGTSLATFSTANGLRALAASEYDLNPATITNNNNVYFNNASLTGAANANLSPNSVTLQITSSVTLGARSILNNQSGAFLATGAGNVVGGGNGFITGPNTNAIHFHVAGGTSGLTVSSPIGYTGAANPSGWTKSGNGTLVLSAPTFLAKNVYVNYGTLQLAGANRLFSAPTPAPGANATVATYTVLSGLSVASGGTFDLAGNDQWIGPLFGTATNGGQAGGGGIVTNSSATAATFRMISPGADTVFGGSVTGNLSLIRQGGYTYSFVAPNTFSGAFTTTGGNTRLIDLGTFENASAITVRNTALTWDDTGLQAVANRLPAAAPINLSGGAFTWNSRADLLNTIDVGAVNMVRGSSVVNVNATAGGSATLSLAALGTRAEGATVTFAGNTIIGTNPFITLDAAPTLTNGMIGGWAVTSTADPTQGANAGGFVTYDPVAGIRALVGYATTASTVLPGNNVRFTGNTTLNAGTNTANSLSVANTTTVSFAAANDLLDLQSGGLLFNATNNAKALGSTAVPGRLTAGGSAATSGTRELFIHTLSNTATVNSNIVDNPAGAGVAVVVGQGNVGAGPVTVLAGNNTYSGATYVNGSTLRLNSTTGYAVPGNLVINGGATTGGTLSATQSLAQLLRSDQVAPTATVTINGAARFDLNTFTNQITNLVFNNDGGETSVESPAVLTNTGTLTLTGSISVPTPSNPVLVPLVAGNLSLGFGSRTVAVDPVAAMPYQIGLAINSGIRNGTVTKTGNGVLFLGGVSGDTAAATVSAGTLTLGNSGYLGGRLTLGSGTLLDMRGGTFTVGSLTGSGTITNDTTYANANTAGTLITGLDGTSTTFSGTFANFENNLAGTLTGMPLNLNKIGTGTLTLDSPNTATNTGTLTVQRGGVIVGGAGTLSFGTYASTVGGTLTLDNTTTAANNRLGGATLVGGTNARTLALTGGSLVVTGNAATAVTETISALSSGNGGSVITLDAADTAGVTLAATSWSGQGGQNTMLVRGTGLGGGAAGPGRALVTPGTIAYTGTQGGGAAGTTTISVRPDILADTSVTGLGMGFATNGANGLRPLDPATELLPSVTSLGLINNGSTTQNVGLTSTQSIGGDTRLNTLTLFSGGGLNNVGNAPAALTVNVAGILAFEGNTGITGRTMSSAGVTMDFHVVGPAATLALDTAIVNTTSGIVKAGDGTLSFGRRQYFTGPAGTHGLTINGGTVTLASGVTNTILVQPTATTATFLSLNGNGGTLDLNGTTQMVERLQSQGTQPGAAGGVTSASGGTLVSTTGSSTTFAGTLTGGLAFQKAGNSTLTLVAESSYTGATTVRGGGLTLRDSAALTGTASIDVNQATLTLDNTGLTGRTDRLGFAGVTLRGGTMTILGRQSTQESQTLFGLSLDGGMSTVTLTPPSGPTINGSAYDLTVFSLTPSNGATANFTAGNGTLGGIGGAPRLTVPGGTNTADIIGGWAVANGSNWATYRSGGIIGAMSDTGSGFATYGSTDLATASGATVNVNDGATRTVTTRTINSLRAAPNAANTITLGATATPATLTIASGGFLTNNNNTLNYTAANIASAIEAGNGNPLYVFVNQNTTTLGTRILGSGGLTKSGNGTLTLNPGSYTIAATASSGGTTLTVGSTAGMAVGMPVSGTGIPAGTTITSVDSGTVVTISQATTQALSATNLTFVQSNRYTGTTYANGGGVLNLSGPAGSVVIPGELVIAGNNSRVTMNTNAGQIASTANVTINGGGVLTLVGTNTLNALTFNNIGGTTQPSVATATLLNLSAATPITAVNDNTGTTPLVSGTALALTNATPTIDVSGLSPMGLVISAPITAAGGQIQKTGTGSLVLSGASTFSTGINVTAGTLIVDNNAGAGTGGLVFADGTSLMGGSAARTIANAITLDGNISLGGVAAANAITVSGAVSMGSGRRTITVEGFPSLATLSGAVGGTGGLEKAGLGLLTLSGTNTYSGGTFVNEGMLAVASDAALGSVAEANFVTLGGGTLRPTATFAPNANHRIVIGPAGGTIDGNGQGFTINAADLLTGSGPLVVQGNGTGNSMLSVSVAQSSLTSDIRIASGRIVTSGTGLTNPLGTGAISVGESTSSLYITTTNSTYSNPLRLFGNGGETRGVVRLNASGNTFSGPITLLGNASLLADGGNTTTFSGTISGNFGAFFGGQISGTTNTNANAAARYIVTGTNSHASTYIGAGTLAINADAALGAAAAPLTINTGTLQANAAGIEVAAGRTITLTTGTTGNVDTNGNDMTIAGPIAATTGSLVKVGLGSLTLGGTAGHTGATTVNQGTLVVAATPAVGSGLAFGTATTITTVGRAEFNTADATYNSLTVRTNSASDNVLSIASGRTLTINGDVVLTNATDGADTRLTTAGGGSLVVSGGSFRVGVNTGGTNISSKATLDLAGLSSLTATMTSNLTVQAAGDNNLNDPAFLILAAGANTITTPLVVVGGSSTGAGSASSTPNTLLLGGGTNAFNTDTLRFGSAQRDSGRLAFAGGTGSMTLRAANGTGRTNITMGPVNNEATAYTVANVFDTTGHTADLLIGTLTMAPGTKAGPMTNTFSFDAGTLDIATLDMAKTKGTGASTNTLNIGGGTVLLGNAGAGAAILSSAAEGIMNITGGTVTSSVPFTRTGSGSAAVNLSGGTLDLSNTAFGSLANTISLAATAGTLRNVASINGTAGLLKTGTGLLRLEGTNAWTGGVTVSAGTLESATATGLGTGNVTIASGSLLRLLETPAIGAGNTVAMSVGGALEYASGVSADLLGSSSLAGWSILPSTSRASTASLLFGTVPAAGSTLSAAWTPDNAFYSDILSLSGTGAGNPFVLSMAYDPAISSALLTELNIARRPGTAGEFTPVGSSFQGVGTPWTSVFVTPGQYGVDTASQTVWVVGDANSQFIVVPEPKTLALVAVAAVAAGLAAARRRRG